jgi:cyclase
MKIRTIKYVIFFLSAFLISNFSLSQKSAESGNPNPYLPFPVQLPDSLITIEKINSNVVLIRMGYDAITAIATQKGIVVIDAGISSGLAAEYRKVIKNEFHRDDIIYLIITHGHPDHTGGSSVFSDAKIIGHENCLNEISDQKKSPEKAKSYLNKIVNDYDKELLSLLPGTKEWKDVLCQKIRYQYAYYDLLNDYPVTKPNITFSDSFNIDMGDVKFNLKFFGKAHSESDILIHIPEEKILMVGDLFSKYGRPGFNIENKPYEKRWDQSIKWTEDRWAEIDIVINGHGQIMSKEELSSFNNHIKNWEITKR